MIKIIPTYSEIVQITADIIFIYMWLIFIGKYNINFTGSTLILFFGLLGGYKFKQ